MRITRSKLLRSAERGGPLVVALLTGAAAGGFVGPLLPRHEGVRRRGGRAGRNSVPDSPLHSTRAARAEARLCPGRVRYQSPSGADVLAGRQRRGGSGGARWLHARVRRARLRRGPGADGVSEPAATAPRREASGFRRRKTARLRSRGTARFRSRRIAAVRSRRTAVVPRHRRRSVPADRRRRPRASPSNSSPCFRRMPCAAPGLRSCWRSARPGCWPRLPSCCG